MLQFPFQAVTRRVLWSSGHLAGLHILALVLGRHAFLPQASEDAPTGAGILQTFPETLLPATLTVAVRRLLGAGAAQRCSISSTAYLKSVIALKLISNLVHDNIYTKKKKSLFSDLLILNLAELAILPRCVFADPAVLSPCTTSARRVRMELSARRPLQSHSYEPQCRALLKRPSFSSVNPTLEKHIFTMMHSAETTLPQNIHALTWCGLLRLKWTRLIFFNVSSKK